MSTHEDRIAKATGLLDVAKWLADLQMGRCTKDWAANKCIDVLDKIPANIERALRASHRQGILENGEDDGVVAGTEELT